MGISYTGLRLKDLLGMRHLSCLISDKRILDVATIKLLQELLRQKLQKKQREWRSSAESVIATEGTNAAYIEQMLVVHPTEKESHVCGIKKLLEEISRGRGERIFLYGEAGQGKTCLLQYISKLWVQNDSLVAPHFIFAFLVPLHMVRSRSIMDILCQDLKLIDPESRDLMERAIEAHEGQTLFLLDSYEELGHPEECNDIHDLITRVNTFPDAAVIVTSRPGSSLTEIQLQPRTTAYLQNFTEEDVIFYLHHYSCQVKKKGHEFDTEFFGMNFLQRPINLALACHVWPMASLDEHSVKTVAKTQTWLFNRIIQELIQVYIKKKTGRRMTVVSSTSIFRQQNISSETKQMLNTICGQCFKALLNKSPHILLESDLITTKDFKNFGLFLDGPEENSVVLPHLLFQEYLAAEYLVARDNSKDLNELLAKFHTKSKTSALALRLEEVVRPLENVIRFVVGLSSGVALHLTDLFIIQQKKIYFACYQSNLQYELDLIHECTNSKVKTELAMALLKAPARRGYGHTEDIARNRASSQLMDSYSEPERLDFLKKVYGITLDDDHSTLVQINPRAETGRLMWDSYAVEYARYMHSYKLRMKDLQIAYSDVPVCMLANDIANIKNLFLQHCTLKKITSDTKVVNTSAVYMSLREIKGFQNLRDITMANVQEVWMKRCGKTINLDLLQQTFPGVGEVSLDGGKLVADPTATTLWHSVHRAAFINCIISLKLLSKMCVRRLSFNACELKGDKGVSLPVVKMLTIIYKLDVDLERLTRIFNDVTSLKFCRHRIMPCSLGTRWHSVTDLEFIQCESVDLEQLMTTFVEVERVSVLTGTTLLLSSTLPVTDSNNSNTPADGKLLWDSVKLLKIESHVEGTEGKWLSRKEAEEVLKVFCPQASIDLRHYKVRIHYVKLIVYSCHHRRHHFSFFFLFFPPFLSASFLCLSSPFFSSPRCS